MNIEYIMMRPLFIQLHDYTVIIVDWHIYDCLKINIWLFIAKMFIQLMGCPKKTKAHIFVTMYYVERLLYDENYIINGIEDLIRDDKF